MTHFGDRLIEASRRCKTPLCMGIDPHPGMIPSCLASISSCRKRCCNRAIDDFSMACVEQAMGKVAAIKPQAAFLNNKAQRGCKYCKTLAGGS